jgi:hypothetical protein
MPEYKLSNVRLKLTAEGEVEYCIECLRDDPNFPAEDHETTEVVAEKIREGVVNNDNFAGLRKFQPQKVVDGKFVMIAPVPYDYMTSEEKLDYDSQVVKAGVNEGKTLGQLKKSAIKR